MSGVGKNTILDDWNEKKKQVECADTAGVFFYEREVWWVHLGANIGYEQDGTGDVYDRPVIIAKKFNPRTFLAVPLSTTKKTGTYYFPVGHVEERNATAILSQIRLLDAKRLINRAGAIEVHVFNAMIAMLVEANFKSIGKNSPAPLAGHG